MRTGKILKKICDEKNIKQKDLSTIAEVSEASISKVFSGKMLLKEKNMIVVIDFLKLTKDEKMEVWKAWTLDRGEEKAAAYFEKLDQENKKLKKILKSLKEL